MIVGRSIKRNCNKIKRNKKRKKYEQVAALANSTGEQQVACAPSQQQAGGRKHGTLDDSRMCMHRMHMQHTQRIVPTSACTSGATGLLSGAGWGTSSPTPSGTHARLHARVAQRHDKTTRAGYSTCEVHLDRRTHYLSVLYIEVSSISENPFS